MRRLSLQHDASEAALADLGHQLAPAPYAQRLVDHALAVELHSALLDHAQRLRNARHQAGLLEELGHRKAIIGGLERHLGHVFGQLSVAKASLEFLVRKLGSAYAVKAPNDLAREQHFDVAWVASAGDLLAPGAHRRHRLERQQLNVAPHELVGNRHELAEDLAGRFGNADVVAERLRHLVDPVEPLQQRHRQDALRLLPVVLLQLAPDQQVELLIRSAKLHVGLHRHRVIALHEGIEELVHCDRLVGPEALAEIVALEHARDGVACREPNDSLGTELVGPRGIEQDFGLFRIENLEYLLAVGRRIAGDLVARERRARLVLARGVADHAGEVADQELHLVAEFLKMPQLVDDHGVTEVQVGRRRVQAELDTQPPAARQLARELFLDEQFVTAALDELHRIADGSLASDFG